MELALSGLTPIPFKLFLASDHTSPGTGKSPTVTLSKAGGAFASATGSVAEVGNGWYQLTPSATDTGTTGALILHATATACDPANDLHSVGAEPIVQSSTAAIPFFVVQAADHLTGLTGASPSVQIAKGGGSFVLPQGTVAEVGNGWYRLTPTAVDTATLGAFVLYATAALGDSVNDEYTVEPGGISAAIYGSAYLLTQFNRKAGRPATDAIPDAAKYQRLSESQQRIVAMLSAVAPASLYPKVAYGSLPQFTTSDNQVFTLPVDANGYPTFAMGHGGVYSSLNDIPDSPWMEGVDYLNEGTQLRIPNNGTYSGALYWYGVVSPAELSASVQPVLYPEASRELIVIDAVRQFAQEGVRNPPLIDEMTNEWDRAWPQWCLVWKTQFRKGGALAARGREYPGGAGYVMVGSDPGLVVP